MKHIEFVTSSALVAVLLAGGFSSAAWWNPASWFDWLYPRWEQVEEAPTPQQPLQPIDCLPAH